MTDKTIKTKIVCMGDSITEGFGLSDPSTYYPAVLNDYLGDKFEVFNKGVTSSCTINREKSGRFFGLPYARQPRYGEALALKGDIYIIMLGTNDAQDGYDPATGKKDPYFNMIDMKPYFALDYQSIINDVRSANPNASIFLVTPIPIHNCIWPKHQERYLAKLLPLIKRLATDNSCCFVDMHKEFELFPEDVFETLYSPDGLHPNNVGANVLASIMASYIKNNMP